MVKWILILALALIEAQALLPLDERPIRLDQSYLSNLAMRLYRNPALNRLMRKRGGDLDHTSSRRLAEDLSNWFKVVRNRSPDWQGASALWKTRVGK